MPQNVTTTKSIGRLPREKGNWVQKTSPNGYKRTNQVFLYGCVFESKHDDNTAVPATYDDQAGTITFNTVDWMVVIDCSQSWLLSQWSQQLDQRIGNKVVNVVFNPQTGYLQQIKEGGSENITPLVTSGFQVEFNTTTGIKQMTPVGSATMAFDTETGITQYTF